MLELRRGRSQQSADSQKQDSPLMGSLYEMEIDVTGITGITVDRTVFNQVGAASPKQQKLTLHGIAPPEKMKAVVAVFCNGEFCASSGLSCSLRKASSSFSQSNDKYFGGSNNNKNSDNLVAVWSKRSRTSKIKFDVLLNQSTSPSDPVIFELWIALTDGKGENKTCISYPVGLGNLPVDGTQFKSVSIELPVNGIVKKRTGESSKAQTSQFGNFSPADEKKEDNHMKEPTVGTVYAIQNQPGSSVLSLKVEFKRKNPGQKSQRRRSSKLSELKEDYQSLAENDEGDDDEDSKIFRPIETSSLVSESACSLGDVVSSKLPALKRQANNAKTEFLFGDFGGIDETHEMDFSLASRPSTAMDRSGGMPSLGDGPKSAFTAISKNTMKTSCSTTTNNDESCSTLIKLVESPSKHPAPPQSPMGLGTLDPSQEEPSELGESWGLFGKGGTTKSSPLSSRAGPTATRPDAEPPDLSVLNLGISMPHSHLMDFTDSFQHQSEVSHIALPVDANGLSVPMEINTMLQVKGDLPGTSRSRLRAAETRPGVLTNRTKKKDDDNTQFLSPSCGVFGTLLQIPMAMMMMKDENDGQHSLEIPDDHTWSTIETRNSSQILSWSESVRAYAAETSSVATAEQQGAPTLCGPSVSKRTTECSCPTTGKKGGADLGWWNDIPSASGKGCL